MGETTREPLRSASPHPSSADGQAHPSADISRCHRDFSAPCGSLGGGPQASGIPLAGLSVTACGHHARQTSPRTIDSPQAIDGARELIAPEVVSG